jgi:hypothetical protein
MDSNSKFKKEIKVEYKKSNSQSFYRDARPANTCLSTQNLFAYSLQKIDDEEEIELVAILSNN